MRDLVISLEARLAIAVVLEDSELHFGAQARARYKALIFQAIQDIATEPERPNVRRLPAAGATIRVYHLHGSRRRAAPPGHRVRNPSHILLFSDDGSTIHVLGLLHEHMDVKAVARRLVSR